MKVQINSVVTGITNGSNSQVSNYGCKLGDTVTLLKYDSTDETWKVSKTGDEYDAFWMKRSHLKAITEFQFKTGDRVTISKAQGSPIRVPATGTIYILGNSTGKAYGVTIDKEYLTRGSSQNWSYDHECIKPLESQPEPKKTQPEYKVGDKVVIVKNTTAGHEVGTQCTITHLPNGRTSYGLVDSYGSTMSHPDYNFTLIETPKTEIVNKTVHQQMLEILDLKPGDKVKVLRKAEHRELGWDNSWVSPMTSCIGKIFEVSRVAGSVGVGLVGESAHFPAHVLELVSRKPEEAIVKISDKYNAQITKDSIVVGCQTISQALMQKLVDNAREVGMKIK